ncbi:glycolipid transfer protein-like [Branchiostoma lanceolatum]|uniref:glycolipid transfer protein-like n=1 Tax=Branchiostoma lanceolatum TaxID=7740 RepID=UPI0034544CC8
MAFFTDYEHQFQSVPEDGKVETEPFLLASLRLLPFFDMLGPTTFAMAKADVSGNIEKVRKKYETDKEKYKTLTDIVEQELEENGGKPGYAIDALLWLKRGLEYIHEMVKNVIASDSEGNNLCPCIQKAYKDSIKKFHPWMLQKLINLAIKAVPYRSDFLQTVGGNKPGQSEEQIIEDLKVFEGRLRANIAAINDLLQRTDQDPDKRA